MALKALYCISEGTGKALEACGIFCSNKCGIVQPKQTAGKTKTLGHMLWKDSNTNSISKKGLIWEPS